MQKDFFRMLGYSDEKALEFSYKLDEQLSNDIKFYREIGCSLIQSEYLAKNVFNIVDTYKAPASLSVPNGFTENSLDKTNVVEDNTDFEVHTDYETDDPFRIKENDNTEEKTNNSEFIEVLHKPVVNMSCEPIGYGYSILKESIINGTVGEIQSLNEKAVESDIINHLDYCIDKTLETDIATINNKSYMFVGIKSEYKDVVDPINIIILVDTSMCMQDKAVKLQKCIMGVASRLRGGDKLSIISYWDEHKLVADEITKDNIGDVILSLSNIEIGGKSNDYAGLISAFNTAKNKVGHSEIVVITEDKQDDTMYNDLITNDYKLTFIDIGDNTISNGIFKTISTESKGQYFKIINDLDIKNMIKDLKLGCSIQTEGVKIQIEFNPAKVSRYRLLDGKEIQKCKVANIGNKRYLVSVAVYEIEFTKDKTENGLKYQTVNRNCTDICEIKFKHKDINNNELSDRVSIKENSNNEHNNLLKSVLALKLIEITKCINKEQLYKEFCKIYEKLSTADDRVDELKRLVEVIIEK